MISSAGHLKGCYKPHRDAVYVDAGVNLLPKETLCKLCLTLFTVVRCTSLQRCAAPQLQSSVLSLFLLLHGVLSDLPALYGRGDLRLAMLCMPVQNSLQAWGVPHPAFELRRL